MDRYKKACTEFEKKLPKNDNINRTGNAILLNILYMQVVGNELLYRYENRDSNIAKRIEIDRAKDKRLSDSRLTDEPYCQHCSKQGLRIIDKMLLYKDKYDPNMPEEVLFMLRCPHCKKRSAFWEDGNEWKSSPTLCPKCQTEMDYKTSETKKVLIFTYTCPSCSHSYEDKTTKAHNKEKTDPNYNKDRAHFCLLDNEFRNRLVKSRHNIEEMAKVGKEYIEKEAEKPIYDAIQKMKRPKIAELAILLSPELEKAGFIEFRLDKPEVGKDVIIGFSCLDNKSERNDYDSERILKKTIKKVLSDTNWRLMSDGIHYRLGYLSGRIRAYEREEELKDLVRKTK
jgi:hypothetical protein